MNNNIGRRLPVSIEAEQSVLGSILIKPESIDSVLSLLSGEDFYLEEHKRIFEAQRSMFVKSKNIDIVTLIDDLVKDGVYDEAGGIDYVRQLAQIVPTAANIKDYAKIVKEKSILRRLIETCEEISDEAYTEQGDVEPLLDSAEQKIYDIMQRRNTKEFRHIKEVLDVVYTEIEQISTSKETDTTSVKTGFKSLDNVIVKMSPGDLVLIGARPGMGKTSFAMNIATNIAKQTKKTVCVFSLEMSCEQIVTRMLSSEALVDSFSLRSGELKNDDWVRLADAASALAGCEILVDDTSGISGAEMKSKLRRVKNLGLVVIDYLQLMQSNKKTDNRVQEVSDISRNLKIMAKELGVPVLCCAQLSRGTEGRTTKKPMLSDLRDSGSIEQDADMVLFLYRDEYYKEIGVSESKGNEDTNVAEVIIAKNRHGSTGTVPLGWNGRFTKFVAIDNVSGDPQ